MDLYNYGTQNLGKILEKIYITAIPFMISGLQLRKCYYAMKSHN